MKTLEITATVSVPEDAIAQATIVAGAGTPTKEFEKALKAAIKAVGGKETDVKIESAVRSKQGPRAKKVVAAPAAPKAA